MDLGLGGKTALVTGASEGIGAAVARRFGVPDDIGDVVCFLVSDRASYVNGAALVVDGSTSVVI